MFRLCQEVNSEEEAVRYLQKRNLLHNSRFCENGHSMSLSFGERIRWRCSLRTCRKEVGLRKGSWFENSKLPLRVFIIFTYAWTKEYTTIKFCEEELELSSHSVVDWKNFLREVCAASLLGNPIKIGGPNTTVEIDESLFSKSKYNRGVPYPQQWVFGGICRETRECFLYAVPNRTAPVLLSCIKENILPGSKIISDEWKAYNQIPKIPGYFFDYETVNHSKTFKDPITGAHTNNIEGLWSLAKRRNKKECGTSRELIDSYLCEFMWRQRNHGKDLFEQMLTDIATFFPLQ